MNDEVTPSYRDVITNMQIGTEYLRHTVQDICPNNRCVRFGWQIDMFAGIIQLSFILKKKLNI